MTIRGLAAVLLLGAVLALSIVGDSPAPLVAGLLVLAGWALRGFLVWRRAWREGLQASPRLGPARGRAESRLDPPREGAASILSSIH